MGMLCGFGDNVGKIKRVISYWLVSAVKFTTVAKIVGRSPLHNIVYIVLIPLNITLQGRVLHLAKLD